jgi:hypothetical protein
MTFTAGDKVNHPDYGTGEVLYGPYTGLIVRTAYLVQFSDGRGVVVSAAKLAALPAFAVGDKVTFDNGTLVTVAYGPYRVREAGEDRWFVVRHANGTEHTATSNRLTPVTTSAPLAVDDKIRILKDWHDFANVKTGDVLTVSSINTNRGEFHTNAPALRDGDFWVFDFSAEGHGWERVSADTYTYNGKTFDLSKDVYDSSGDAWSFTGEYGDGYPLMTCTAETAGEDDGYANWTFKRLFNYYGGKLTQR